ncbi:APC family permease [Kineosporia sp. A_224]|uniref:APC family permease n=1 Tax=Kineosporia sp. A_224 TaxID=1962180 RepID=UPI0013041B50|nr:APC family permease [Kineosporia sp. A_224]
MSDTVNTQPVQEGLQRNAISSTGVVFLVLAAASPLIGLTGAVPTAMVLGNGLGASAAYIVVGLILALFGVSYVAMSRQVTNTGALYAYVGRGLGLRMGLGAGSIAIWAYVTVQIAVYGFFGAVASGAVAEWFGVSVPWWALTFGLMLLVQVFGYLHVEVGAKLLGVLMALEWGTIIVLSVVIFAKGGAGEGYAVGDVFSPSAVLSGAPGVALVMAFASMFGFESTAIYGEEVRDPKRSIPRATFTALGAITLFFAFNSWALVVGYGPSKAIEVAGKTLESGNPAAYVFDAGGTYLGAWAPHAMTVFVITSMFACNLAFHNGIARYLWTLSRDGVLPAPLAKVHPKTKAPYIASFTQTAIAALLVLPFAILGKDPVLTLFFWGSGIAVVGVVTLYILVAVAAFVFFRNNPTLDGRAWNTKIAPVLAAVAMSAALVLIIANFDVLIGSTGGLPTILALTVPTAFIVGLILFAATESRIGATALADLDSELT